MDVSSPSNLKLIAFLDAVGFHLRMLRTNIKFVYKTSSCTAPFALNQFDLERIRARYTGQDIAAMTTA